MLRKGFVIGIVCILILISLPIAISDSNNIKTTNDKKHIVFFRANNLEHYITNNDVINTPIGIFSIFINKVNDFVRLYFEDKTGEIYTDLRILDNGKPDIYDRDVSVEFNLDTKNSFVIFMTSPKHITRGFAICDSVSINDI